MVLFGEDLCCQDDRDPFILVEVIVVALLDDLNWCAKRRAKMKVAMIIIIKIMIGMVEEMT